MPTVHDADCQTSLQSRIQSLRPDSTRRWGKMTPDQMLWHVNKGLEIALGRQPMPATEKAPLPRPIIKFLVLNLPWPKGAPTSPSFVAKGAYDFESEKKRCLELVQQLGSSPIDRLETNHFVFGKMSGTEVSRLQAKHLDHHLKQFSV